MFQEIMMDKLQVDIDGHLEMFVVSLHSIFLFKFLHYNYLVLLLQEINLFWNVILRCLLLWNNLLILVMTVECHYKILTLLTAQINLCNMWSKNLISELFNSQEVVELLNIFLKKLMEEWESKMQALIGRF